MALKFLNNATFAGTVSTGGYLTLNSGDNIPRLIFNGSGDDFFFSNTANYFGLYNSTDSRWDIKVDGAGDTTFAGAVTVEGGILHLGKADTASGHINAKELMTFNIDTDNDDTNRYFAWYTNSSSGSGTELLKILETGAATFSGDVTTDGIFKVDTAPDDNILEVTQSGRKMALKTSFAGDTVGSFWAFRVSNGNVNGGTTDALIVRPQNATFAGNVTVGHDLKMSTNGEIDWNAGAVKLIGTADDIKLQGGSLSITGDGSNAVTLTESGNGDFTIDAPDDIRLDAGGGDIVLKSAGTEYGRISKLSSDLSITSSATNSDILINPNGNGNVGIGTTSPSDKLEIGNLSNYTGLTLKGAGASRPAVTFKNVSQSLLGSIYGTESRGMIIETGGNGTLGTVAMTLSSTGALKLNTYTAGTLVSDASGNITVSSGGGAGGPYLPLAGGTMTGNTKHNDNVFSYWGNNDDLAIRHNATDTYIENYTGDLQIVNYADDKDIIFKSDDGSGGTATYFRVDGGAVETRFLKSTRHFDDVGAYFGDSADLQIYHTGNDSYIKDAGTGDLRIVASLTKIYDADMSHLQASFTDGGSVDLYYSGNKKFETTNTGIKTGNIDLPSNGAILFDNTNNTEQYYIRNGGGSQSSFQIGKGNPGSDIKLIIDDGGNVGIGTTAPLYKLDINETTTNNLIVSRFTHNQSGVASAVQLENRAGAVNSAFDINWGLNSSGNQGTIGVVRTNLPAAGGSEMYFKTSYGEVMRIDGSGNVGIGTTSPLAKLHAKSGDSGVSSVDTGTSAIIESDTTNYLRFLNPDSANAGLVWTSPSDNFAAYLRWKYSSRVLEMGTAKTNSSISFSTGNADERMRITSAGNVGIGTTSPAAPLNVAFADNSSPQRWSYGPSESNYFLELDTSIPHGSVVTYNFNVKNNGTTYNNNLVLDRGNVGIGTTDPKSKLDVDGGVKIGDDTDTASADKVGTMRYRTGTEYVEVTGTEILPNPGFDTDTNWVKGTGWTIANGKASVDNASSTALSQPSFGVTTGKIYNVRIDVSNYTSGSLQVQFGASQVIASIGANGEYNYTVTSTITGGTFYLYGVGDCEFSVDNASVIEVEAEDASYADMCMQTGSSTYEWVNIVRNTY